MRKLRLARTAAVDRRAYILDACRGARVLHLGCVDHPFLAERLAAGTLLHAAIAEVASELWGVDLDAAGLETLRAANFTHLHAADIEHLANDARFDVRFDVIVAGEIVEHLTSPGAFLRQVPRLLAPGGKLLVTVPSAQSIRLAANALRGVEVVHPDHKAYFSPHTLTALLAANALTVVDLKPYWAPPRHAPALHAAYDHVLYCARLLSPWLGEGLVATAIATPSHV
ncbi:MAG TPA: methyltransferase domain-containing protein [Kofleriaceae bacterium]|nr:methyltransferase domain-containing protein [Kofleriaceae bacterium]